MMRLTAATPLRKVRKLAGEIVFNHMILPPRELGTRLKSHSGDYGHGYFYEEVFCRDPKDLLGAIEVAKKSNGPILDLAGGAGRFSEALSKLGMNAFLLDNSFAMLASAEEKRKRLMAKQYTPFTVIRQDIGALNVPHRFGMIFSLKNGLEHLKSPEAIVKALKRIREHALPKARLYIDVHNLAFCEQLPFWKQGEWYYTDDFVLRGSRVRMWSRTFAAGGHCVRAEHALSHDFLNYVYLTTPIQILPVQMWKEILFKAGWDTKGVWGNWYKDKLTAQSTQAIFEAKLLP